MAMKSDPTTEEAGARFEFGRNWKTFLSKISDDHIREAQQSFQSFTALQSLEGKRFLDVGCGSGLHSYTAYVLGASDIISIDYDSFSVEATQQLKTKKAPAAAQWTVMKGDILSETDRQRWGLFDFVYAWGSLHHTGHMWKAIEKAGSLVKPGGLYHLALYNKHWTSPIWKQIKHLYCISPHLIQRLLLLGYEGSEWLRIALVKGKNPRQFIKDYPQQRGMIWKEDLRDWLGGYPYEYASPEEIKPFLTAQGFFLVKEVPNRSLGCSEFLFRKGEATA
jgi:2-polyprenyl-6-hydroxyphenyl methylase/3-demethylubiquinone-9 3-methyltransferase